MDALLLTVPVICPGRLGLSVMAFARRGVNLLFVPEHVKAGHAAGNPGLVIPERPSLILGTGGEAFRFRRVLRSGYPTADRFRRILSAFTHRRIRWSCV